MEKLNELWQSHHYQNNTATWKSSQVRRNDAMEMKIQWYRITKGIGKVRIQASEGTGLTTDTDGPRHGTQMLKLKSYRDKLAGLRPYWKHQLDGLEVGEEGCPRESHG